MGEHAILRGLLVSGRKTRCARVEGTERCAVFDVRCVRAEGRLGVLPLEPAAAVTNRWTREHSSWEMSVADSEEVRSATPPEDLNVPILEVSRNSRHSFQPFIYSVAKLRNVFMLSLCTFCLRRFFLLVCVVSLQVHCTV